MATGRSCRHVPLLSSMMAPRRRGHLLILISVIGLSCVGRGPGCWQLAWSPLGDLSSKRSSMYGPLPCAPEGGLNRREGLNVALAVLSGSAIGAGSHGDAAGAAVDAPVVQRPFEWTFLWDRPQPPDAAIAKTKGLSVAAVAAILKRDLAQGKYILTGNLTASIFADDCRFVDPNNAVNGLAQYRQALAFLFDPVESSLELRDVSVAEGGKAIDAQYIASGTLKLPWRPRISAWSGNIRYTFNDDGLVSSQVDTWNITRFDAIRQTFTLP
mmetsp:Transcript_28738/g.95468  ORF Transcript_28738/g.95468 Transcript_28738/m.95468 type:complete len:270 (-) Transcript_28738:48-857(-)